MTTTQKTSRSIFITILFCIFLGGIATGVNGQDIIGELKIPDEGESQLLITKGGSKVFGRIVEIKTDEIMFESEIGVSAIQISDIEEIKLIKASEMKGGSYWFPNPNQTRLYFGPTGRMLKKGEGYISDIYIFFPSFAYGMTDNITLGAGFTIFPGIDIDKQILFFTPKIGLSATENFHLAMSGMLFRIPDDFDFDDDESESIMVGLLFATATYGNSDKSITVGLGHGFVDDEIGDKPAFCLGGEYRFARRVSFVSENWVFPDADDPLVSYGVRLFGEKMSIDLAFFNVLGDDAVAFGIPYIDFVWNF